MTESILLFVLIGVPVLFFSVVLRQFDGIKKWSRTTFGISDLHDTTVVFGSSFGISLLWIAISGSFMLALENEPGSYTLSFHIIRNIATVVFSGIVGGIAAMLISPLNSSDQKQLNSLTKALSVFVTGFLIGKIDQLFGSTLANGLLVNTYVLTLIALSLIATMGAFLMTFVTRIYGAHKEAAVVCEEIGESPVGDRDRPNRTRWQIFVERKRPTT
jgi:hypothetical protein